MKSKWRLMFFGLILSCNAWAGVAEGIAAADKGDYQTGFQELSKAMKQGDPEAAFYLAIFYEKGLGVTQSYPEALRLYRRAAEQGHPTSQYLLAAHYQLGQVVEQNIPEALAWYRKSAEAGYVPAQNNLGMLYRYGKGVPQNYREALHWLRKAAEAGNGEAIYNLGVMYEEGLGVPKNKVLAYTLYNIAAAKDIQQAVQGRDDLAAKLTPAQVAEAQELSSKWKEGSPLPSKTRIR